MLMEDAHILGPTMKNKKFKLIINMLFVLYYIISIQLKKNTFNKRSLKHILSSYQI